MSDWTPPPFGTPVWIGIPAQDLDRATAFYQKVFSLPMRDAQPASAPTTKVRLFDFTQNGLSITGGIMKVPESTGCVSAGKGGICMHWFVEDVDAVASVIEDAGGRMLSKKEMEGDHGAYRYFEDTEGSVGAVYMYVP